MDKHVPRQLESWSCLVGASDSGQSDSVVAPSIECAAPAIAVAASVVAVCALSQAAMGGAAIA